MKVTFSEDGELAHGQKKGGKKRELNHYFLVQLSRSLTPGRVNNKVQVFILAAAIITTANLILNTTKFKHYFK